MRLDATALMLEIVLESPYTEGADVDRDVWCGSQEGEDPIERFVHWEAHFLEEERLRNWPPVLADEGAGRQMRGFPMPPNVSIPGIIEDKFEDIGWETDHRACSECRYSSLARLEGRYGLCRVIKMNIPNRAGGEQVGLPLVQNLGLEMHATNMRDVGDEERVPVTLERRLGCRKA